jgi:polysaccharide export outer membrane protein
MFVTLQVVQEVKADWVLPNRKYFCKQCILLGIIIFFTLPRIANAQQVNNETKSNEAKQSATTTSPNPEVNIQAADNRYRIGVGDLLDIRVLNRPTYSRDAVRVGTRGTITMPFITEEIQAACLTESELAREIAKVYLKLLRNPQIDVFVKEYNSQPIAVIGAVNAPGRFQLQRRVRLLEVLALVGGPSQRAGREVQIIHSSSAFSCEDKSANSKNVTQDKENNTSSRIDIYKLSDTLRGEDHANPYLQPGDIVKVPDAMQVFIVGNILHPQAISLTERITLMRAIAMAGGTLPDTKSSEVKIFRESADGVSRPLMVDLDAIRKQRAEDVVLQPNDIVEVPSKSGFVRSLKALVNGIVPSLTALPITVIR